MKPLLSIMLLSCSFVIAEDRLPTVLDNEAISAKIDAAERRFIAAVEAAKVPPRIDEAVIAASDAAEVKFVAAVDAAKVPPKIDEAVIAASDAAEVKFVAAVEAAKVPPRIDEAVIAASNAAETRVLNIAKAEQGTLGILLALHPPAETWLHSQIVRIRTVAVSDVDAAEAAAQAVILQLKTWGVSL